MKKINVFITIAMLFVSTCGFAESETVKDGWTAEIAGGLASDCTEQLVAGAKQGYFEKAKEKKNDSPKPFPEIAVRQSMGEMCSCVVNYAAHYMSLREFSVNASSYLSSLLEEATKGNICKPKGIVEEAMKNKKG